MDSDSIKKGLVLFGTMVGMYLAGAASSYLLSHC